MTQGAPWIRKSRSGTTSPKTQNPVADFGSMLLVHGWLPAIVLNILPPDPPGSVGFCHELNSGGKHSALINLPMLNGNPTLLFQAFSFTMPI